MIRKSILLMLAIAALAAAASPAQASTFMAEKYPATIEGTQVGQHVFTVEKGLTMQCTNATFLGTLTEASSTATLHPTYEGCKVFGLNATISSTGCDYRFHAGEEVAADRHAGTVDVVCTGGSSIVIATATCEVRIDSQTGLGSSNVENNTNPLDATATGSLTGITYTKTKDGIGCPLSGTGTMSDGSYAGTATAIGTNGGKQVGIWVEG